jgi:hypothetical protein
MGVEGGDAGWDGDVELVEVFLVAAPGEDLAVGGEDDAGDLVDGAGGAVVAGDPLGRGEGDGAGMDRNVDLGVVELRGLWTVPRLFGWGSSGSGGLWVRLAVELEAGGCGGRS